MRKQQNKNSLGNNNNQNKPKKKSIMERFKKPTLKISSSQEASEEVYRENYSFDKYGIIDQLLCKQVEFKDLDERWRSDCKFLK